MKASSRAHGRVRQEVFLAIIERMSKSMLAMLIWSVIGSVALVLVLGKSLYVVHLVVFVPIGLLAFKHSAIWFDVLMVKTTFSHFTGSSNKMSVVDDNMLLGRCISIFLFLAVYIISLVPIHLTYIACDAFSKI